MSRVARERRKVLSPVGFARAISASEVRARKPEVPKSFRSLRSVALPSSDVLLTAVIHCVLLKIDYQNGQELQDEN